MKLFLTGAGIASLMVISSVSFAAECGDPPPAPEIPDGKTATLDELRAASAEVKKFAGAGDEKGTMELFLDCVDSNREAEFELMNKEQQERWMEDFDAMDTERVAVADRFNEQARIWQANQKKK